MSYERENVEFAMVKSIYLIKGQSIISPSFIGIIRLYRRCWGETESRHTKIFQDTIRTVHCSPQFCMQTNFSHQYWNLISDSRKTVLNMLIDLPFLITLTFISGFNRRILCQYCVVLLTPRRCKIWPEEREKKKS